MTCANKKWPKTVQHSFSHTRFWASWPQTVSKPAWRLSSLPLGSSCFCPGVHRQRHLCCTCCLFDSQVALATGSCTGFTIWIILMQKFLRHYYLKLITISHISKTAQKTPFSTKKNALQSCSSLNQSTWRYRAGDTTSQDSAPVTQVHSCALYLQNRHLKTHNWGAKLSLFIPLQPGG